MSRNRRGDRLKILAWDRSRLWVLYAPRELVASEDVLLRVAKHPQRLIRQLTPKGWADTARTPVEQPAIMSQQNGRRRPHLGRVRRRFSTRRLIALVEEAIVDAYGESEQRVGFLTMLAAILDLPMPSPQAPDWEWIAAYCHWERGGR